MKQCRREAKKAIINEKNFEKLKSGAFCLIMCLTVTFPNFSPLL